MADPIRPISVHSGFQTAKGNTLAPSDESIARAAKRLPELADLRDGKLTVSSSASKPNPVKGSGFAGFKRPRRNQDVLDQHRPCAVTEDCCAATTGRKEATTLQMPPRCNAGRGHLDFACDQRADISRPTGLNSLHAVCESSGQRHGRARPGGGERSASPSPFEASSLSENAGHKFTPGHSNESFQTPSTILGFGRQMPPSDESRFSPSANVVQPRLIMAMGIRPASPPPGTPEPEEEVSGDSFNETLFSPPVRESSHIHHSLQQMGHAEQLGGFNDTYCARSGEDARMGAFRGSSPQEKEDEKQSEAYKGCNSDSLIRRDASEMPRKMGDGEMLHKMPSEELVHPQCNLKSLCVPILPSEEPMPSEELVRPQSQQGLKGRHHQQTPIQLQGQSTSVCHDMTTHCPRNRSQQAFAPVAMQKFVLNDPGNLPRQWGEAHASRQRDDHKWHRSAQNGASGRGNRDGKVIEDTGSSVRARDKWRSLWIPPSCIEIFQMRGIMEPHDWQMECLMTEALQQDKNLVYALPTSCGKTFVAEIIMIKKILKWKKYARRRWDNSIVPCKGIFVFPYVSLCQEKKEEFERLGDLLDFLVEPFYDQMGKFPLPPRVFQLCFATIEKAERILTSLFEEGRAEELGLVVVDELHFVGENSRGCLLENLLTRLRTAVPRCQIVGMSATLPNLADMQEWLGAEKFDLTNLKRPIELHEHVVCGRELIHKKGGLRETLPQPTVDDKDLLVHLVKEGAAGSNGEDNGSVLVFCPTVNETEAVAKRLHQAFSEGSCSAQGATQLSDLQRRRQDVIAHLLTLQSDSTKWNQLLRTYIEFGIAFHHAKLLKEERRVVEDAYKRNIVNVLTSTSTLAAGVNLPAGRVIITRPVVGIEPMKPSTYNQMVGRAGRTGYQHESGKTYIFSDPAKPHQREFCIQLMHHGPSEVRSQLMAPSACFDKTNDHSSSNTAKADVSAEKAASMQEAGGEHVEPCAAKAHADEFMRTVLSFVCMGRLPPATEMRCKPNEFEAAGPMGGEGVTVAQVQAWIRQTFLGVVLTRLEKDVSAAPDIFTLHKSPDAIQPAQFAYKGDARPQLKHLQEMSSKSTLEYIVHEALLWLESEQLITRLEQSDTSPDRQAAGAGLDKSSGWGTRLHPTALGRATYLSALPIAVAKEIYTDMTQGRKEGVVLVDQLHLLFMMAPVEHFANRFLADDSFWALLARKWERDFDEHRLRVLQRIGIDFVYVQKRAQRAIMHKTPRYREQDRKGKRLWLALIIHELVEERPIKSIIKIFSPDVSEDAPNRQQLSSTELEDLQSSGAMFSGKVAQFALNVGYEDIAVLCQNLISRIANGAKADILPLCEIPQIQVVRARKLYRNGYKTLDDVAAAKGADIARVLSLKPPKAALKIAEKMIESARSIVLRRIADQRIMLEQAALEVGDRNLRSLKAFVDDW